MDNIFDEAIDSGVPVRTDQQIRDINETLFKSTDKELTADYIKWWAAAFEAALSLYHEVAMDGSESALRMRMLAAARVAQLSAAGLNFFGSATEVLSTGPADIEAASAVARVTTIAVENKVEKWLKLAQSSQN